MKIILKPAGFAIVTVGMLGLGFFLANRVNKVAPTEKAANFSGVKAKSYQPVLFSGQMATGWTIGEAGKSLQKSDTKSDTCPLSDVKLTETEGEFRVKVSCTETTPGSVYPKYGIGIRGVPSGDELSVWIDPQTKVLTTYGQVSDNKYDWHATPLPTDFDMSREHTLSIRWSDSGKEWAFTLDNDEYGAQTKHLSKRLTVQMPVLLNYESRPVYRDPEVR